jgi:hypothetical protein
MSFDRRAFLGGSLAATAAGFAPAFAAPNGPVLSTSFISKLPEYTAETFRTWYETHHAPDFLEFAKPYLMRYERNFVVGSARPNPGIDVISEFGFKSPDAQAEVLRLMATPAGARIKGPPRAIEKSLAVFMDEQVASGPARGTDRAGTRKLGLLLKKKGEVAQAELAAQGHALASAVAANFGKRAERVVLDLAQPGQTNPAYDGLITVWLAAPTAADIKAAAAIAPTAGIDIVNVLELECQESDLGGGKA